MTQLSLETIFLYIHYQFLLKKSVNYALVPHSYIQIRLHNLKSQRDSFSNIDTFVVGASVKLSVANFGILLNAWYERL